MATPSVLAQNHSGFAKLHGWIVSRANIHLRHANDSCSVTWDFSAKDVCCMEDIVRLGMNCVIDKNNQTVCRGGKPLRFSDVEFRILLLLIDNMGVPVSVEKIIKTVWLNNPCGHIENVKVQIRKIRERIETEPGAPEFILSVRGKGYILITK